MRRSFGRDLKGWVGDTRGESDYTHRTITGGIGHNLPQEAPERFVEAIIEVDGYPP